MIIPISERTRFIDGAVSASGQKPSKKCRRSRCAARWSPRCSAAKRPVRFPQPRVARCSLSKKGSGMCLTSMPIPSPLLSCPSLWTSTYAPSHTLPSPSSTTPRHATLHTHNKQQCAKTTRPSCTAVAWSGPAPGTASDRSLFALGHRSGEVSIWRYVRFLSARRCAAGLEAFPHELRRTSVSRLRNWS